MQLAELDHGTSVATPASRIHRLGERQNFDDWIASLEARHLADFTFREVARALRALSSTYVERRQKLAEGAALATAGKRAAFALFYGPLHFLLVAHVVDQLAGATSRASLLIDLGCGTGASGAAWATRFDRPPKIVGVDRNAWTIGEAAATYRAFGLSGRTHQMDVAAAFRTLAASPSAMLAAFTLNELPDASREALLTQLLNRARSGHQLLVVEPIAGGVARWWGRWRGEFERAGGRADEWRVRAPLPAIVAKLDRAAGLDHRELTGRSLWIDGTRRTMETGRAAVGGVAPALGGPARMSAPIPRNSRKNGRKRGGMTVAL